MGFLRAALAFAVVMVHYRIFFTNFGQADEIPYLKLIAGTDGAMLVNSFFVISGYYGQLLLEEKFPNRSAGQFYVFRWLRLLPHYYLSLLLLAIVSLIAIHLNRQAETPALSTLLIQPDHFSSLWFWIKNVALIDLPVFKFSHFEFFEVPLALAIPLAWTLALEMLYILIAPLLRNRQGFWLISAISAVMASYFFCMGVVRDYIGASLVYLMAGAIGYKCAGRFLRGIQLPLAQRMLIAYGLVAGIAIMVYEFAALRGLLGMYGAYGAFMLCVIVCVPVIAHFSDGFAFDRVVGQLAYPVYLSHFAFFAIAILLGVSLRLPFILAGCLLFALLCYYFVETPITRWRHKRFLSNEGAS